MVTTRNLCCFYCLSLKPMRFIKYSNMIIFFASLLGFVYSLIRIQRGIGTFSKNLELASFVVNSITLITTSIILILYCKRKWKALQVLSYFLIFSQLLCLVMLVLNVVDFFQLIGKVKSYITEDDEDRRVVNMAIFIGLVMFFFNFFANVWFINLAFRLMKMSRFLISGLDVRLFALSIEPNNLGFGESVPQVPNPASSNHSESYMSKATNRTNEKMRTSNLINNIERAEFLDTEDSRNIFVNFKSK